MTDAHLSFEQIREAARDLAQKRRDARMDYSNHAEKAADADRKYRKGLAIAFTTYRTEEKGVGEAEILANADVADQRYDRDVEQALAKSALLRIDELERDGAFLRQLGDWSKNLESVG